MRKQYDKHLRVVGRLGNAFQSIARWNVASGDLPRVSYGLEASSIDLNFEGSRATKKQARERAKLPSGRWNAVMPTQGRLPPLVLTEHLQDVRMNAPRELAHHRSHRLLFRRDVPRVPLPAYFGLLPNSQMMLATQSDHERRRCVSTSGCAI